MDKTKEKTVRADTTAGAETPPAKAESAEPERGAVFGRYTVLDRVATGGTATVFSAYDAQRERVVALKLLRAQLDTPEARARVVREAQAMARLKHPNVVRVYEVGTFGDRIYIAMELVDGSTLRKWMSKPRPWQEVLDVLKAAGRGLAAAHEAGLVHRDFNPEKILIAKDGRVLVTDFGIARREEPANHPSKPPSRADSSEMATHSRLDVAKPDRPEDEDATVARKIDVAPPSADRKPPVSETDAPGAADADDDATVARRVDPKALAASAEAATDAERDGATPAPAEPVESAAKASVEPSVGADKGSTNETSEDTARPTPAMADESAANVAAAEPLEDAGPRETAGPRADLEPRAESRETAEETESAAKPTSAEARDDAAKSAPAASAPNPAPSGAAASPDAATNAASEGEPAASGESAREATSDDDDATVARKVDPKQLAALGKELSSDDKKLAPDEDEATVAFKVDTKKLAAESNELPSNDTKPTAEEEETTVALKIDNKSPAADDDDATIARKTDTKKVADETGAPKVQGTPGFIAPEHLASGQDTTRSDQFSFAVTMYVTLYGKHPYRFRDLATYRDAVRRPPQPPPASPVPAWIQGVIERGLRRDPQQRFSSMTELLDALDRDPSRRRRWWGVGAAAAAAGVAALVVYGQHRADVDRQCAEGATLMASTWNPAIERRTREALAKQGGAHGAETANLVTSRLSAYAQAWTAAHRRIAEATLLRGDQDTATMERRMHCLERGREQLGALAEILSRPDGAVGQHAVDATFALPAAELCATADANTIPSLPSSPDLRARVRTAERAIAEAIANDKVGDDRKAEEIIVRALPDVRAIPHPRSESELLLVESDCKQDRGDAREAFESADTAFQAAERAGDDALAVRAAARMAYLLSSWLDKPQEAERWMKRAEAIADRAGHNDALDATLLASRIPVNAMLGYPERNLDLHDKEVALLQRLYTDRDPRVARAVASRGITYYLLGKFERALVDMQQGVALLTRVAGSTHPQLVHDYTNLGAVLLALGRTADARDAYEHARALQADAPPGPQTVTILGALASIELEVGTPDSAIETAERGLEVAQATGEKGMLEWALRLAIAKAKGKKGDFAGEAEDCRAVLALQKAADAFKRDAPYTPDALTCLGLAELGQHHVDAALAHLEESVTFQLRTEPGDLPLARFALAKALRIAGRDAVRAREMALSARNDFLKLPNLGKELEAVESWLEESNDSAPAQ